MKRVHNFKDLKDMRFGRLTVLNESKSINGNIRWDCKCDCGNTTTIYSAHLNDNGTMSCGCINKEITSKRSKTHGMSKSSEFSIWNNIIDRCTNPKAMRYKSYGGRGITISNEWRNSFAQFYKDMGDRPSKNHSIERNDNNKGYSKNNCRWATSKEQNNNKRNNRWIIYNGKRKTLAQWSDYTGITNHTILARMDGLGWSIEKTLTTPVRKRRDNV